VPVESRCITDDEISAWAEAMRVGFLSHAEDEFADVMRADLDLDRTRGAFEGDRVVGTLRSFAAELTVPGGTATCSALTNVTVSGTHPRRGLLSVMLAADLAESAARGEVVSALIAADYPIYGRFG
jgi:predicted acetyltransferase